MKVTIKDVAELAGVSFKTVSRVVNGESGVRADMREKVQRAISELNYQPNLSARRLRGKSSTVAFIYNNPNSHYVVTMLHGILSECRASHYELLVHPCDSESPTVIDEVLTMVRKSMVEGLILTPPMSEDERIINQLDTLGIKFVRIISSDSKPADYQRTIYINDRQAAYQITQHLIEQQHQQIAFFNGEQEHKSSGERLAGYLQALKDNGLNVNPQWVFEGKFSFESGKQRARELMSLPQFPSAIFACNDEIAAGALFTAKKMGKLVPQDIAIAGFEDSPFSQQTWPLLTTARQPNDQIAAHAAELLISMLSEEETEDTAEQDQADHGYLPKIVIRESTLSSRV